MVAVQFVMTEGYCLYNNLDGVLVMKSFYLYSKLIHEGVLVAYRFKNADNYYIDFSVQDVINGKVPSSFRTPKKVLSEEVILYNNMYCTPVEAQCYKEKRVFESRDAKTGLRICHIDSTADKQTRILALKVVKLFITGHPQRIGNLQIKGYNGVQFEPENHAVRFNIISNASYNSNLDKVGGYLETYFLRWFQMMKVQISDVSVGYIDKVYTVSIIF